MKTRFQRLLAVLLLSAPACVFADGDLPTKFSNQDTIGNTRHNMTQRQTSGGGPTGVLMDQYRNDYVEICVYCHTPHGSNSTTTAPLWNRTMKSTTYTTYSSATITGAVTQPGPASLACLSCHDGQTAVDSVINMPGSGKYRVEQETTQNDAFLSDNWNNTRGGPDASVHIGLNPTPALGCLACHSPPSAEFPFVGVGSTDFTVFAIGTDLTNDHPVGVAFPAANPDFNATNGTQNSIKFFDSNGNNRADKNEIRVFDSGGGHEVECASCHDPHGVPSGGSGSTFNPTFLRISNAGSALCMTCHVK